MNNESTGLYGKLPAYGDFLTRNLGSDFVEPWDDWLQCYVSAPREQMGEDWLDIYLTSPIWRFVLSSGVIDQNNCCGVLMPSVDRVGRYFPLTIVRPFSSRLSPVTSLMSLQGWYQQVESFCLSALEESLGVDELVEAINQLEFIPQDNYQSTTQLGEPGSVVIGLNGDEPETLADTMAMLLTTSLTAQLASFSLWQTGGSELVAPSLSCCQGLPPLGNLASMMDGQWQQRYWKIPYNLKTREAVVS